MQRVRSDLAIESAHVLVLAAGGAVRVEAEAGGLRRAPGPLPYRLAQGGATPSIKFTCFAVCSAVTHRGSAARQCMHKLQIFAAHSKQKES